MEIKPNDTFSFSGRTHSAETKRRMSMARRGRQPALGLKHTEETKRRISESLKGKRKSEETKAKLRAALLGRTFTAEALARMSQSRRGLLAGERHPNWKGGVTAEHLKVRLSREYAAWRRIVFERDQFSCVICGDATGHNLEADHVKPFAHYPHLRLQIENGRTLCKECHKTTPTWGAKSHSSKQQWK